MLARFIDLTSALALVTALVGFHYFLFAWLLTIQPSTAAGLAPCFAVFIMNHVGSDLSYWKRLHMEMPRRKASNLHRESSIFGDASSPLKPRGWARGL